MKTESAVTLVLNAVTAVVDNCPSDWSGTTAKGLSTEYLNLNNLTFLPECTYELTNLKDLDIESNKILSLSPNIKKLKNLESIGLAKTNILYLPDEMISLRKLKEIYANDTMKYVPKTLLKYMQNDYYIKK